VRRAPAAYIRTVRLAWLLVIALAACGTSPSGPPDATPSAWQLGPALPGPRLEPGVTAIGNKLAMVDGFDDQLAIVNEVDLLDPVTGAWTTLPSAPVAWTHLDAASAGGSLYLLGGLATTQYVASGDAYVLDLGAAQWRQLTSMPAGLERGAAGVVAAPPHIYLIGGAVQDAAVATVLDYNISTDSWTQLPDLPSPRSHPAAGRLSDGTLIVAGGLRTLDATQPIDEVLELKVGATAWTPRAAMPTARGGCAYGMLGTRLVCAGGEAGQAALHVTEAYTYATDSWETLEPMPLARAGTQGAAIGTRLFVPGGAHKLAFIPDGTMDVYTVP